MKNIYQRIAEVQKACPYAKKDTQVGFGNHAYKAITHDGVLNLVRPALIANGVVVQTSHVDKGLSVQGETKSGTAKIRFEALYDVTFVNADDPQDRFSVRVEAHGEDSNDKAPGKAISYATKTAMLKVFLIETGENDEARMEESKPFTDEINWERELKACQSLDELAAVFGDMPASAKKKHLKLKDELKLKLTKDAA